MRSSVKIFAVAALVAAAGVAPALALRPPTGHGVLGNVSQSSTVEQANMANWDQSQAQNNLVRKFHCTGGLWP